jgi:hypothetical protein
VKAPRRDERGPAVLLAFPLALGLALLGPGGVLGQEPPSATRPDSLHALVLDRIRPPPAAPEAEPADSVPEEPVSPGVPPPRAVAPEGADPLMRSLLQLEGFRSATYEGARATFQVQSRTLVLQGGELREARFYGDGVRLSADTTISYDDRDGRIRTTGSTEFTRQEGEPVTSRTLVYSLEEERGTAMGAETIYSEGGPWIVRGDLDSLRPGVLFGSTARFTSCLLEEPHSSFEASQIKVVGGQMIVARSVKMYIADVPVLWLPFVAQNLGTGRASGLLTPVFSVNDIVRTSAGYERRISNVGYYWAMSPYSDLSVAMDWFSSNYTALEARMGYRWARNFLDGNLNLKRYWRETGRRELALSTANSWLISERSSLRASGRYVSSSDFVRQNSLDPREATQTVDSDANLNRRFDWGSATLGASRRQYLNEERTEMTLPSASLSLSTLTLLSAPPQSAAWYNNLSLSGSTSWTRRVVDRAVQPDSTFSFFQASRLSTEGSASGTLGLADLSLGGQIATSESVFRDVPATFLPQGEPGGDFRSGDLRWSARLSYRLGLIGATTLTPNVSVSGTMLRVDSIPEARSLVAAPTRVSMGVGLHTELYGFYPGFGPFEAMRHKVTPSVTWSYSPDVRPTELQVAVFGARISRRQSVVSVGFNQTWEARLREGVTADTAAVLPDTVAIPAGGDPAQPTAGQAGPTRLPQSPVVTLLSLQTGVVTYDLVQADSTGRFLDGFTTTSLSNTVGSDYLRGLSLSFTHDLFEDPSVDGGGGRRLRPHLSQLSMNFSLSNRSGVVRALGSLVGLDRDPQDPAPEPIPADTSVVDERPSGGAGSDANRVIPSEPYVDEAPPRREGWDAQLNYSLRRPRSAAEAVSQRAQMLSASLSFAPTEHWSVRWNTSYDLEARRFNDHVVQLIRDLHEWEASFGFVQTATGNWSFSFEVSLRANQDLRFDYEQRSLEGQRVP